MGKSDKYKVTYTREDGKHVTDGQQHHTRKSAKHRAKQLSDNNFKLQDITIVHPDGTEEILELN